MKKRTRLQYLNIIEVYLSSIKKEEIINAYLSELSTKRAKEVAEKILEQTYTD